MREIIELKKDDHQHKGESMRTTGKKSETNKSYLCLKRQEHPVDYRKSDPPSTDASASSSHVLCLPNGPPVE